MLPRSAKDAVRGVLMAPSDGPNPSQDLVDHQGHDARDGSGEPGRNPDRNLHCWSLIPRSQASPLSVTHNRRGTTQHHQGQDAVAQLWAISP